jgi:uncharacterized protein (TIGR02270 family)
VLRAPRLWDVVEEHLDDAAFLWGQWERALVSPVQRPREIAVHVERLLRANLEGVRLACPDAVDRLLLPALRSGERDRVAAAAAVLAEVPGGLDHLTAALGELGAAAVEPVGRALGLSGGAALEAKLPAALLHGDAHVVAAALAALAFRRLDPGPPLLDLLRSGDPVVLLAALRAARASAQPVRGPVEVACASPRPAVRDAAIATGLRLGLRAALTACERLLETSPPEPALPYQVVAMSGDPSALARLEAGLDAPSTRREALAALGLSGWPRALDRILACAEDPELARLAGEAFTAITGLELDGPLLAEEDDAEPPALEDDDLEQDLATGPEADLPRPDPDALRAWWQAQGGRLDPALRQLEGEPWSPERLHAVFCGAAMRRRHALGLELAVRTRGQWDPEPRGWASDQVAMQARPPRLAGEARLPFPRLLTT